MNYCQKLLSWALAPCLGACYLIASGLPAYAGKDLSYDSYQGSRKTFSSSSRSEASNDFILGSLHPYAALLQPFSSDISSNEASGFVISLGTKALSNRLNRK